MKVVADVRNKRIDQIPASDMVENPGPRGRVPVAEYLKEGEEGYEIPEVQDVFLPTIGTGSPNGFGRDGGCSRHDHANRFTHDRQWRKDEGEGRCRAPRC